MFITIETYNNWNFKITEYIDMHLDLKNILKDDANMLGLKRRVPGRSEGTGVGKLSGCWAR